MGVNKNKIEARRKKVLEVKLNNPQINERDLAKQTGSSNTTVHRDLTKLKQDEALKTDITINAIKDADLEILTLGQSIILDRFRDDEERAKVSTRDVSAIAKDSQVRYSFLAGENAKANGGEKEIIWNEQRTYDSN